ncbi:phosphopantothenoylcysteine decarboxylase/phosphopantothenate/cysteine ligase [Evansella cellulosilytica DSM 2522]|uniref:Coenzyme A biosynthesis bifunctional protein CoaBC n=1 Tax=Evansella cellulosilytica (strain ATCC 21833 / DSM 2522 / FERM P-1141 / JCM 9156 / N-4) TaxID=649639 RepID=E6TTP3_EVAC2|nr:phosphopantothenoylcysteine decarboxylase/phosphopantothenate/cysteine ligase [Evansella cellulosilytica DSM 2522]
MEKRNVLLCVSGGIAVFKSAALTSKLVQANYNVKVVMTKSACEFVTPLTFQALSRDYVYTNTFEELERDKIAHIDVADWADVVVVAPATANVIGKLANGIADDMLTTTLLATTVPVYIAPAMNVHMYEHPAVKKNMDTLHAYGYQFIEPNEGYLACGYVGKGRMAEPDDILSVVQRHFTKLENKSWQGKKILVTAGPTQEKIDPVRFYSNRSSGKMGYAIAEEAAERGAEVILITGPTNIKPPHGVTTIPVESASDMYDAVTKHFEGQDIVIKAAAVADYRPKTTFDHKVKKQSGDLTVEMERTLDILKTLGEQRTNQILVGFAAESENIETYAKNKLNNKNLDMIAANSIISPGTGFQSDTNELLLYKRDGQTVHIPMTTKKEAAKKLLDNTLEIYMEKQK